MLTVNVICIGKLKESYLQMAQAEYQKRLGAFCKLQILELSEYKVPSNPTGAQIEKAIAEEGKAIVTQLDKCGGHTVALCIEGKQESSEEFASNLSKLTVDGVSTINFVIGGSFGLAVPIKARGKRFSMSKMTFPHQLARVLLLEQIYRGFQIQSGGKYHK